jgi:hypothetical protein
LKAIGINIDEWMFIIRLPEPQNFGKYRQLALDADLINAYSSVKDEKMLSTRFKLERYLGLTTDEIQMNEVMLKEELEIDENTNITALRQIYDPVQLEARTAAKIKPKNSEKSAEGGEGGGDEGGGDLGMGNLGGEEEPAGGEMGGEAGGLPDLGAL